MSKADARRREEELVSQWRDPTISTEVQDKIQGPAKQKYETLAAVGTIGLTTLIVVLIVIGWSV